jgi:enoyl-CoA hydratase/carnithine racemase
MDTTPHLEVEETDAGVWTLRLARPERRNALTVELQRDLADAIETLAGRPAVAALVLTASGPAFSAGFDLDQLARAQTDEAFAVELWATSDRLHHAVLRCAVPILCALNGPALAGGFDLATLCDLRIGQPGVWFARPEVDFGVPMFGPLRELVGGALARELCLTTRRVELDEAVRIGLVNRVAGAGGAYEEALGLAAEIARRPTGSVRALKSKMIESTGLAGRVTLAL